MSRDPIGYAGSGWNLYEYVRSQPALLVDPSGLLDNDGWFNWGFPSWNDYTHYLWSDFDDFDPDIGNVGTVGCYVEGAAAVTAGAIVVGPAIGIGGGGGGAAVSGAGMTSQKIMLAFFNGQTLANTPANVAALQWYLQIAQNTLNRYDRIGYVGTGIATQRERIEKILEQLAAWGIK